MVTAATAPFTHEAFVYAGEDEFLAGTVPFLEAALEHDHAALVVVSDHKIRLLRSALAADGEPIQFADMDDVGRNPARTIPAWQEFAAAHPDRSLRGIGEPITDARSPAALTECHRHEALLNLSFARRNDFHLLCPYDSTTLTAEILEAATHTHPYVSDTEHRSISPAYDDITEVTALFDDAMPGPGRSACEFMFTEPDLPAVRRAVRAVAADVALDEHRTGDMTLAVSEIASNSIRHGGGIGMVRLWVDLGSLVCEVRDAGWIRDPMAGRVRPPVEDIGGRGLWLVNQLCDLVQIRTSPAGTVVRLHITMN